jgi:dinuclear metal center YbgI/SA1388 family protein
MKLNELSHYNASLLQIDQFKDYCPNGLQIEGRSEISRIATAVTASEQVLNEAIAWGAHAIIVHHGYFWRNEDPCITGIKKKRIALLLKHDINLLAYHLPLDAHSVLGNNAQLAKALQIKESGRFGEQAIAWYGSLQYPVKLGAFGERVATVLRHTPQVIGRPDRLIQRIAWCSGGGQSYFESACALGVQAFLTGEISEQNYHQSNETGVSFIAAGHHATERLGVQALGKHLADRFKLEHRFFDQDNPI